MKPEPSIMAFFKNYIDKAAVSFHMPGHKGSQIYKRFGYANFLEHVMDFDITEIPGADNLFQAEGIIKGVQARYARLYGCKKSYLLVNGSSGGNIAAILASVSKGKQLLMARNCHKSVFNALALGGIRPVYAYPDLIEGYEISGAVSTLEVERLIIQNPDVEAVFITSPNYYGVCSDIKAIAEIAHSNGKILIVDEAHGAHLHFSDSLPQSALSAGADLVINSTHKTLASFTQSAVLHFNTALVDQYILEDKLQCIQSTSPSYILMASLDINADILENHGKLLMDEWLQNLTSFYDKISQIPGIKTMDKLDGFDLTKINLSMGELGITGSQLEKILIDDYNIFIELFTGDWIMAMSGIGNKKSDYERFVNALEEISRKASGKDSGKASGKAKDKSNDKLSQEFDGNVASKIDGKVASKLDGKVDGAIDGKVDGAIDGKVDGAIDGNMHLQAPPKQAVMFEIPDNKKRVRLEDSEGMICGSSIIPYPPGIPLICPGERIEADAIEYIRALRNMGEKIIGINEFEEIIVGV